MSSKLPEKLSVTIITYNEENNIGRCIESVRWADEIIVVDSHSTDRTVEICRSYTDKVFSNEFSGHIQQKNLALSYSSNEWILALDADEAISESLIKEIRDLLASKPVFDGYFIKRENYYLGGKIRYSGWNPDYKLRFFRKSKGKWGGMNPHDSIVLSGKKGYLKAPIIHFSYPNLSRHLSTIDLFTTIAAAEYSNIGRKYHFFDLIFRPPFAFVKKYFLKTGFLDGTRGLMLAISAFFYIFLKYAKLWELQNTNDAKKR